MCVCLWVLNFLWEPTEETLARGVSYENGRGDSKAVQVERSERGAYRRRIRHMPIMGYSRDSFKRVNANTGPRA